MNSSHNSKLSRTVAQATQRSHSSSNRALSATSSLHNGSNQRVLITGGAGFIGTNVAAKLAGKGYQVHLFDDLSRPGVERNLQWLKATFDGQIRFQKGDIRDAVAVQKAVAHCSMVFHFAAQVAVTTSLQKPEHDFEVNALGTLNLLQACRALKSPPPLLFTSTNKVYGELGGLRLKRSEDCYEPVDADVHRYGIGRQQPLDFHSPYGCSKGVADQYVLDYARCWDLPTVVFRMSCIYGTHQCGNEDQGWVAHFVRQTLDRKPITLFGDGCQVRDLLYVDDLVRAMLLAMRQVQDLRGQAFNIGGGPANAASLRDVLQRLGQLHDRSPEILTEPWRQGDQRYYVSDIRDFTRQTGWQPKIDVQTGIQRLYEWMQSSHRKVAAAV